MRFKKTAAILAATSAAVVGLGIATAGTASAATSNWGCRADQTGSYASVGGGVYLDSCIEDQDGGNGSGFYGLIRLQENAGSLNVDPCAQLYKSDGSGNWNQVYDFGCMGWNSGQNWNFVGNNGQNVNYGGGAYMVKVGFWATINGNYGYYGDIESPVASTW